VSLLGKESAPRWALGYQFGTSPERSSTGSLTILQTEISLQSISVFHAISYEF